MKTSFRFIDLYFAIYAKNVDLDNSMFKSLTKHSIHCNFAGNEHLFAKKNYLVFAEENIKNFVKLFQSPLFRNGIEQDDYCMIVIDSVTKERLLTDGNIERFEEKLTKLIDF